MRSQLSQFAIILSMMFVPTMSQAQVNTATDCFNLQMFYQWAGQNNLVKRAAVTDIEGIGDIVAKGDPAVMDALSMHLRIFNRILNQEEPSPTQNGCSEIILGNGAKFLIERASKFSENEESTISGVLHEANVFRPMTLTFDPKKLMLTTRIEYLLAEVNRDVAIVSETRWTNGESVTFSPSEAVFKLSQWK